MKELDAVALYHYKLKLAYEDRIRRRFNRAAPGADADEEATQAMLEGVVDQLSVDELLRADAADMLLPGRR